MAIFARFEGALPCDAREIDCGRVNKKSGRKTSSSLRSVARESWQWNRVAVARGARQVVVAFRAVPKTWRNARP